MRCYAMPAARAAARYASALPRQGIKGPARAPVGDAQDAAEHAAQVREMRHALLASGHPEKQLEQRVGAHHQPSGEWNRDRQHDELLARKEPAESQQHTEYASRGAERGANIRSGARDDELSHPGHQHAHQKIDEEAPPTPKVLQRAPEHEEGE